jgi:hypothetical protein
MPRTAVYSGDSGKVQGVLSGGDTGVPSGDGGLDTNAVVGWDPGTKHPYSVHVFAKDGNGAGLSQEKTGYNQPYEDQHTPGGNDCVHDFSKGHGAAPPTFVPHNIPVVSVGEYNPLPGAAFKDPTDTERAKQPETDGYSYLPNDSNSVSGVDPQRRAAASGNSGV